MEDQARLALEAAILRDAAATRAKARAEPDFDAFRQSAWFQRLIQ